MSLIKRISDLVSGVILVVSLSPLLLFIALAVKTTSKGPVIHWSARVGKNGVLFKAITKTQLLSGWLPGYTYLDKMIEN